MDVDLAGFVGGTPERYVPDLMRGELVEAEHLSRYWWVGPLVRGRRVLDAGCGVGYGSVILLESGASEVVGVDIAEPVIEAAQSRRRPGIRFERGDIERLQFPDACFDAVVCFETIEHVDDPESALAELARVLVRGGLLAVSSPNRSVYPPGNPHHRREFLPNELAGALEPQFAHVQLLRQDTWVLSAILDEEAVAAAAAQNVDEITVRKALAGSPGPALYTLALASDEPLPQPAPFGALTHPLEPRRWLEHVEDQQRVIADQADRLGALATLESERQELLSRLEQNEPLIARIPALEQELEGLRRELALERQGRATERNALEKQLEDVARDRDEQARNRSDLSRELEKANAEGAGLRELVQLMETSISWRMTQPLRAAKARVRKPSA